MGECAARGPVNLWHAPKAIGILHTRVVVTVRLADLTVSQETAKMSGCTDLSAMRTGCVNALVECGWRAAQCFERHGSGEVEELGDAEGAVKRERSGCSHRLCAIQERESFLGFEREGLDSGGLKGATGSGALALIDHLAFADESECQVR
jgi:hypothetical protein